MQTTPAIQETDRFDLPDFLIWIIEKPLSDGSAVFDVIFHDTICEAATEDDAESLASKVAAAIRDHSNSTVEIRRETQQEWER